MSIPSSSELVATTAGSRPAFNSSSMSKRCSRRDRAVVSPRHDQVIGLPSLEGPFIGDLVEARAQSLGQPASVHEDDRRLVCLDEVEQLLLDVRPHAVCSHYGVGALGHVGNLRRTLERGVSPVANCVTGWIRHRRVRHVLDGHDHGEVEVLFAGRVDDGDRAIATEEGGHLLWRPHGRGETEALGGAIEQLVEPFEAEREVCSALVVHHCVHLVDDHRLDVAELLPCARGQQQEE